MKRRAEMKTEKKKIKIIPLIVAVIIIASLMPLGIVAYAQGDGQHTHTETCYAEPGVLLCGILEDTGHIHDESCRCPGGETVCGQEESESHTHSKECFCAGGELICGMEEKAGHLHDEDCYAKGGELICGEEDSIVGGIVLYNLESDGEIMDAQELLDAVTNANDGDTLKLGADITYDANQLGKIIVNKQIVLDFNGYTLYTVDGTFQYNESYVDSIIDVESTGSLTLVDAQIKTGTLRIVNRNGRIDTYQFDFIGESKGTVIVQSTGASGINAYNFIYENYGKVEIKDGLFNCEDIIDSAYEGSIIKVENGTFNCNSCFVDSTEKAEITIENCNIISGSYCFDDMYDSIFVFKNGTVKSVNSCFYVGSGNYSSITIYNGVFESEENSVITNHADSDKSASVLIIYDGSFTAHEDCVINNYGDASIYGGIFTAENDGSYKGNSAIYNDGDEGFGTITLYGGEFSTGDKTPAMYSEDGGQIIIATKYHTEPEEWQDSDSVKVVPNIITVTFHSEGEMISSVTDNPDKLVFPSDPVHTEGFEFCYWETEDNVLVDDLSLLTKDTDLYAVFSDRTYTVSFNDKGEVSSKNVIAGTPLGKVPGLDRTDTGDGFLAWRLNGETVNADTSLRMCSDLTLTAVYKGMVLDYDELLEALEKKEEVIMLGADIIVEDTIIVDYDCTLSSYEKFGLIRPDNFAGVLLTTKMGVTGGEETEGVTSNETTLTLDNILVDGRNIEADATAVLVDKGTTLILKDSIIQNNVNNAYGWNANYGGGICNKGTLKMYDGTIIRNNRSEKGGGIYNAKPEEVLVDKEWITYPVAFYMYGGEITGNTATDNDTSCNAAGGGVNVDGAWSVQAKFYMYNGKISGNSAPNGCGGGVSLCCGDQPVFDTDWQDANVVFTMYGGEITDNITGESGGGIWVACSSFAMEGGLISRNTAAEDGGGISACCGCELNANITGGEITLNAAKTGGGIGSYVGGVIKPDAIYDNLASETGDDIVFSENDSVIVLNRLPARPYGQSYASEVPLSEFMQQMVRNAKKDLDVELLQGYPEPTGVMIPFLGWFVDGNIENSDVPRYDDTSGDKHDLTGEVLDWTDMENGSAVKAVWQGIVLLYDANYTGNTDYQYDPSGYLPGDNATVLANMFERQGYRFIEWNTQADGNGTSYSTDDLLLMKHSQVLYAQWEKLPTYTVTYEVKGDPVYGIPAGGESPVDQDSPYIINTEVNVLPDVTTTWTTSDGTESGWKGTWTFSGWDKDDFSITEDTVIHGYWTFTPSVGDITVSKTVSGNDANTDQEFAFTIALDRSTLSGIYGDITFKDGVATFTLKANESKTAHGLPAGVGYTVSESNNEGYTVTVNNVETTSTSGTIIADDTVVAVFNNHKDSQTVIDPNLAKVMLKAQKTLDGKIPSGSEFSFVLKDKDGNVLQTQNNQDGDIQFDELKFSQAGTYIYYLEEVAGANKKISYDNSTYKVIITVTRENNLFAEVSYEKNDAAFNGIPTFSNTTISDNTNPDKPGGKNPQTGDHSNMALWVALIAAALAGIITIVLLRRKSS